MSTFIGIDGIPGGWVAVYIDDKQALRFDYSCNLDRLLNVPTNALLLMSPSDCRSADTDNAI